MTAMLYCRWRISDGAVLGVNDDFCAFFGVTREAVIGQVFLPTIPEAELAESRRKIQTLSTTFPLARHVHRVIVPDRGECWMEWSHLGEFDGDGMLEAITAWGREISAIVAARLQAEMATTDALGQAVIQNTSALMILIGTIGRGGGGRDTL